MTSATFWRSRGSIFFVSTPGANCRGCPTTAQMPPFGKAAASSRFMTTVPTASKPSASLRFDSKYIARPRQSRSSSVAATGFTARLALVPMGVGA